MSAAQPVPSGPALQLILTAERLFAKHGLDGVPLRQIAVAAGSANNSAVHYHFGSKEKLVDAIFAYRIPALLSRRALLHARSHPDDLRGVLEVQLLPVLELAETPGSSYLSFLEQLERSSDGPMLLNPHGASEPHARFVANLEALLPEIDEPVRTMRIREIQQLTLQLAAERERKLAASTSVISFGLFVSMLLDGCVGYLQAPISDDTRRFLESAAPADVSTYPPLV